MENIPQNKRKKKDKAYHPAEHARDVNSRTVFKNNLLTSQFLQRYTNLPVFASLKPEDIEDVSAKYQVYLGVEYEADTIKKVYIRDKDGCVSQEIFVISLIEHKSNVDYDVSMQLLRYMCAIWQDYKAEQEKLCKNGSKSKNFRYPIIIPIVYYEGKLQWTADLNLKKRIEFADEFGKYVPDFTYEVVSVNQYTNEELGRRGDEMSLVMQINKIQTPEDLTAFLNEARESAVSVYANAPEEIKKIYRDIIWALLIKENFSVEETKAIVEEIGGNGMGILFENMEKMDIQAE